MRIGIIGAGRFGTLLQKHLSTDNAVLMFDKLDREHAWEELHTVDLVIFAVPNRALREAAVLAKNYIHDAIVMDVGSVKTLPCQILQEIFPEAVAVIGTHPLFGPDSAEESWQGHKMVFCKLAGKDSTYKRVQELFTSRGVIPFECTPAEHDQMMARTQALVHFVGRALTGIQSQDISTPDYANLLRMMEKVTNDTWELFFDMQNLNPSTTAVRKNFIEKINILEQEIEQDASGRDVACNVSTEVNDLSDLRSQIDDIDEQIVGLIGRRFAIAQQIGKIKKDQNAAVRDDKREAELYIRMHELSQRHAVPLEVIIHIYDYLMDQSRKLQS